jgi:hypothetical protein
LMPRPRCASPPTRSDEEHMTSIPWMQARLCAACGDYHYSVLERDKGRIVLECKVCGACRDLCCPCCGADRFTVKAKLDALDRPYRRPFCACTWTDTSLNVKISEGT